MPSSEPRGPSKNVPTTPARYRDEIPDTSEPYLIARAIRISSRFANIAPTVSKWFTNSCAGAGNLLDMVFNPLQQLSSQTEYVDSYFSRTLQSINGINQTSITELLELLSRVRKAGSSVFIAGNGGSASTAEHIALDWMLGTGLSNPPLRVISLAQSSASITATGNDFAIEDVFSRPLKSLARKRDLLLVISASGNSPNLLKLVDDAKTIGVQVIAMTGFDGGRLAQIADLSVHVPTAMGDYGVAEDLHLMIGHIVKEALIAGENSGS